LYNEEEQGLKEARDLIYTIGNKKNYMAAIAEYGAVYKTGRGDYPGSPNYPGGYAFKTAEDAQRRIDEAYPERGFAVFGLNADWVANTEPNPAGGWWHNLLIDAEIVVLSEAVSNGH
jgi:hypothetical protein